MQKKQSEPTLEKTDVIEKTAAEAAPNWQWWVFELSAAKVSRILFHIFLVSMVVLP